MNKVYVVYRDDYKECVDFVTDNKDVAEAHYNLYHKCYDEFDLISDDPAVDRARNAVNEYIFSFVRLDNGYFNYCGEETRLADPAKQIISIEEKAAYDRPLVKIRINGVVEKADAWKLTLETIPKIGLGIQDKEV